MCAECGRRKIEEDSGVAETIFLELVVVRRQQQTQILRLAESRDSRSAQLVERPRVSETTRASVPDGKLLRKSEAAARGSAPEEAMKSRITGMKQLPLSTKGSFGLSCLLLVPRKTNQPNK